MVNNLEGEMISFLEPSMFTGANRRKIQIKRSTSFRASISTFDQFTSQKRMSICERRLVWLLKSYKPDLRGEIHDRSSFTFTSGMNAFSDE
jgi:hypothetical protein